MIRFLSIFFAGRTFTPRWRTPCAALATALLALAALAAVDSAAAKEAAPAVADPALEERTLAIAAELRCLVCQNQTIADSNAGLAVDLRDQVRNMLREGKSQREILDFMTQRYGDFVLYRPPLKPATALLWFGPPALLVVGSLTLWLVLRKRSRMSPDAFEPDEPDMALEAAQPAQPAQPDARSR
jgi:cytochrome c-type biogenesis protein CcmH